MVDDQLQRRSRRQGPRRFRVLRAMALLDAQRDPCGLEGLTGQECHRGLVFSCATFVAAMVMGKHAEIESLWGDVACATKALRCRQ